MDLPTRTCLDPLLLRCPEGRRLRSQEEEDDDEAEEAEAEEAEAEKEKEEQEELKKVEKEKGAAILGAVMVDELSILTLP